MYLAMYGKCECAIYIYRDLVVNNVYSEIGHMHYLYVNTSFIGAWLKDYKGHLYSDKLSALLCRWMLRVPPSCFFYIFSSKTNF